MALVLVVPVVHEYRSTWRNPEIDPLRPEIIGIDEVFAVARRIARSGAFGDIHIDPEAIDVVHENRIPIDAPVLIAQVEHSTGMGMPATGGCRTEVTGMGDMIAQPMQEVGEGVYILKRLGKER